MEIAVYLNSLYELVLIVYTANVLIIEAMDLTMYQIPPEYRQKSIETLVIILNYLEFKIQILFLFVSENHGLLPINKESKISSYL